MSEAQLLSHIETLESQAQDYYGSQVARDQAKAMDYYLGKPRGDEEEGLSSANSSDVLDVVEGLTSSVLEPFVASDDLMKFVPEGPEDEDAAEQESDYINFVATQKNDSFAQLMAWVKTGLLQKNGVVKYWWEQSRLTTVERYYGVPDDVMAMIAQEDDVEIIEHTDSVDDQGQPVHDITLRVSQMEGEAKYAALPPEEFLISRDATSPNPKAALFCEHRRFKTISALREMGYEVDDNISDSATDDTTMSPQYLARRDADDTMYRNDKGNDPSTREVFYREVYANVDYDGDGMAELRKICVVGRTILDNEETEEAPFAAWTPSLQAFKFYGRCPADETIEIQDVKTTLWRQSLNNIYTINNNRTYANEDVNVMDLVDNQIAGIVRVKGSGNVANAVRQAEITPIGQVVQPMIEYLDSAKENRTGYTRYNQGTDSESLNKTATGVRLITQAGNQRTQTIQRAFGELGLKPLMLGLHGLCRRHATKAETVRLRGKWVQIDPRGWKTRRDMSVQVGLGTADKQMQMQAAQLIKQAQMSSSAVPGLVTPENVYAVDALLVTSAGFKNPDRFFTNPANQPPPQPPDPSQNPEFKLKAADIQVKAHAQDEQSKQAAAANALKARELDLKEQQMLLEQDIAKGQLELQAQAQGMDMQVKILQTLQELQSQVNEIKMGHAQTLMQAQQQEHDQALARQQAMLQAQSQAHDQQIAQTGLALDAQGQAHSQGLAEQAQALDAEGQSHAQQMAERAADQAEQEPSE